MQGRHTEYLKLAVLLIESGADMTIRNNVCVIHSPLHYSLHCLACLCIVCNGFYACPHFTSGQEGNPPLHHAIVNSNVAFLSHVGSEETVIRLDIDGHVKNQVRSIADAC